MKVEELESMSVTELLDLANKVGVGYPRNYDKDKLVELLKTVPEDDTVHSYVDDASNGMLVAFRTDKMKVKSAKIVKKSSSDRKLLLETKYGAQFIVDYSDVIWVNTTGRWPRWVFNLMKGIEA